MDIELEKDVTLTFRCDIKGLLSPLIFNIEEIRGCVSTLELLFSSKDKEPSSKSYEVKFFGKNKFRVHAETIG